MILKNKTALVKKKKRVVQAELRDLIWW